MELPRKRSRVDDVSERVHAKLVQLNRDDKLFQRISEPLSTYPFDVLAIIEVQNPSLYVSFQEQCNLLQEDSSKMLYHATRRSSVLPICAQGMDVQLSNIGFFGRGLYFSEDFLKANDYAKPAEENICCMLLCQVALGRVKEYPVGHYDRALIHEPDGFDSVRGFMNYNYEYVVYKNSRVYVSNVILYQRRPFQPIERPLVPPNVSGEIVLLTSSMTSFLTNLKQRAGPTYDLPLKVLIRKLLTHAMKAEEFITAVSLLLNKQVPAGLAERIENELSLCKLNPKSSEAVVSKP